MGSEGPSIGIVSPGDRFGVERIGTRIGYRKNGALVALSEQRVVADATFRLFCSFFSPGAEVRDARLEPVEYRWQLADGLIATGMTARFSRRTGLMTHVGRVQNTGALPVAGPFRVVVENPNVELENGTGTTEFEEAFVLINRGSLAPGEEVLFELKTRSFYRFTVRTEQPTSP